MPSSNSPYYLGSGFFSMDVGLGSVSGQVVALGDFNADKYTDIFVLSSDKLTVSTYLWAKKLWAFSELSGATIKTEDPIVNVAPGDYDRDANLDLLVMTQKSSSADIKMIVYFGDGSSFSSKGVQLKQASAYQPMVADFNGTMGADLLGSTDGKGLYLWNHQVLPGGQPLGNRADVYGTPNKLSNLTVCADFKVPHSNAFVDIDGDCMADLVFFCKDDTYQVWINQNEEGGVFGKAGSDDNAFRMPSFTGSLPSNSGSVSFADMDGDGTVDMVVPSSSGFYIVYNEQMELCKSSSSSNCRSASALCLADENFQMGSYGTTDSNDKALVSYYPYSSILSQGSSRSAQTDDQYALPLKLYVSDYNLDGYADVLLVTNDQRMHLLESVGCSSSTCTQAMVSYSRRWFSEVTANVNPLAGGSSIGIEKGAVIASAFWIDLNEDGSADIIVNVAGPSGSQIKAIANNYYNDAFFLKMIMLNGVCPSWCPFNSDFPSHKPYGANYVGATFKFTVLDTSGSKRAAVAVQMPQTSYMALMAPSTISGLGRTTNYIENFFAGSTRRQDSYYAYYTGIIPNSQIIITPYQPIGIASAATWTFGMFMNPSDYVGAVLAALVTSLTILIILVLVLRHLESREDAAEKRKLRHEINFDAL